MVLLSTANPNRDGTGTTVSLLTAGASGSRIDRVVIKAVASTTIGMIRFYIFNGSVTRLLTEIAVSAVSPTAGSETFELDFVFDNGLLLQNGSSLVASTNNAEQFNVFAFGGDF
jgi:hypothetical protein